MIDVNELKFLLAKRLYEVLGISVDALPEDKRPSAWLEKIDINQMHQELSSQVSYSVWEEGPLPNGLMPPPEAVPGETYYISLNGVNYLQYRYSPNLSPNDQPELLTRENVEYYMLKHVERLLKEELTVKLINEYLKYVANLF